MFSRTCALTIWGKGTFPLTTAGRGGGGGWGEEEEEGEGKDMGEREIPLNDCGPYCPAAKRLVKNTINQNVTLREFTNAPIAGFVDRVGTACGSG